ncbi:SpoIIE family protein phosphatase [Streptomyces sp. NPDC096934]|uniref:SpoIIE family protein phosphatase n=1 Tax=Streptomyces sp. NPDC096934 TaxID=3155551 RepID=UPI0033169A47
MGTSPRLPIGVDTGMPRRDHARHLAPGSTVILHTDGVTEHPDRPIDQTVARLAAHASLPLQELLKALADHHPGDGHDAMALLAVRTPPPRDAHHANDSGTHEADPAA